jgi:hypothetical protein
MARPKAAEPAAWIWFAGFAVIWPAILLFASTLTRLVTYFIPWDFISSALQIAGLTAAAWLVARLAYRSGAPRALWIVVVLFSLFAFGGSLFSHVYRFSPTVFGVLYAMAAPAAFLYESRRPQASEPGIEHAPHPDASRSADHASEEAHT